MTPNAAQTSTNQRQKHRINILGNKINIKIYIDMFPVGQVEYKLLSVQRDIFRHQYRYIIVALHWPTKFVNGHRIKYIMEITKKITNRPQQQDTIPYVAKKKTSVLRS